MFARADGIHLDRRGGRISAKVAMTETALAELLSQDLSGLDLVAVIFDVAQDSTHFTLSYSSHIAISGTDSGISSALPTSTAVPPARSERIPFRIAGVAPGGVDEHVGTQILGRLRHRGRPPALRISTPTPGEPGRCRIAAQCTSVRGVDLDVEYQLPVFDEEPDGSDQRSAVRGDESERAGLGSLG